MGKGNYQKHLKYKVRICCNLRNASVSFGGTLYDRLCEWKNDVEKTIAGECVYIMNVYKSVYAGVNEDERTLCIKISAQDTALSHNSVKFSFNEKRALINSMTDMDILKEYEGEYIIYEKGIGFNVNDGSSSIVIGVKKKDRHEIVKHPKACYSRRAYLNKPTEKAHTTVNGSFEIDDSVEEYIENDNAEMENLFERYQKVEPAEEEESLLGKNAGTDNIYQRYVVERALRKAYERFVPANVVEATKELVKNLGGN